MSEREVDIRRPDAGRRSGCSGAARLPAPGSAGRSGPGRRGWPGAARGRPAPPPRAHSTASRSTGRSPPARSPARPGCARPPARGQQAVSVGGEGGGEPGDGALVGQLGGVAPPRGQLASERQRRFLRRPGVQGGLLGQRQRGLGVRAAAVGGAVVGVWEDRCAYLSSITSRRRENPATSPTGIPAISRTGRLSRPVGVRPRRRAG